LLANPQLKIPSIAFDLLDLSGIFKIWGAAAQVYRIKKIPSEIKTIPDHRFSRSQTIWIGYEQQKDFQKDLGGSLIQDLGRGSEI
jgi:hypothetical protein